MIIVITASGALSPGPLTIMTMASGIKRGWKVGLIIATGHMIIELPYVILLALVLDTARAFLDNFVIKSSLAIITICFMGYFAYLLLLDYIRLSKGINIDKSIDMTLININPLAIGIIFTLFNPYFLLWWATLGLELVKRSIILGLITGIIYLYALHVWMDYAWLTFIAYASSRGVKYLGSRGYRILLLALALMLILFAVNMASLTFLNLPILPI